MVPAGLHPRVFNQQPDARSPERIHPPGRSLRSGVRRGMVRPVIRVRTAGVHCPRQG